MANSNKQIRLAQESTALAEEKQDALNEKEWQFNGESDFSYDMMMGDTAMNSDNGLYMLMTSGDNKQVVLNAKYAAAMMAAGIQQTGGNYSDASLAAFMDMAAGKPSQAEDWTKVITDPERDAKNKAIADAKTFISTYGTTPPQQGNDPSLTQVVEDKNMSISDILSRMGNTGNFTGISNHDGRSTAGSDYINEQTNVNMSYTNLVQTNGYVCLIDDKEDLSYDEIWSRSRAAFQRLADNIISKIKSATGISDLEAQLKPVVEAMKNQINGNLSRTEDGDEDDARDGGRDTAKNSLIGVGVDDTATDQVWVYCNPAELARRLLAATANIYHKNDTYNNSPLTAVQNGSTSLNTSARVVTYKEQYSPYTNDQGKTYEEWNNAFRNLSEMSKNIVKTGEYPQVATYPEDDAKLNKYKQIFDEACQSGWVLDSNVNNKAYLTNKLTNNQYLIKHNDRTTNMKNSGAFELVKKYDKDEVNAYYETKESEFKVKDKKLQAEQNRIQTELTAINSEQESVKTLIQNNIEKGFTFGYNA